MMKNLFKKMFADKIIGFKEGANVLITAIMKVPFVGDKLGDDIFNKEHEKVRIVFGVFAQIGSCALEFLRKLIYVFLFMYIPYLTISVMCPNIKNNRELTMIFMFTILSTICGSIANNTMMTISDKDYLMIRVILISPYMNFIGKIAYKMFSEFIYYTIILCIFGVSFPNSILLSLVTAMARPIGEMIEVVCFDYLRKLFDNRGTINGLIMAAAILVAYIVPYYNRSLSTSWYVMTNPIMVIIMVLLGVGAMYYLWIYKHYRAIMREALHIKSAE